MHVQCNWGFHVYWGTGIVLKLHCHQCLWKQWNGIKTVVLVLRIIWVSWQTGLPSLVFIPFLIMEIKAIMIINHPSTVKLEMNVRYNKEMLAKKCEPPLEIEPSTFQIALYSKTLMNLWQPRKIVFSLVNRASPRVPSIDQFRIKNYRWIQTLNSGK